MTKTYDPKNSFRLATDLPQSGSKLDSELADVSDATVKISKWIERGDLDQETGKLKAHKVNHHNLNPDLLKYLLDTANGDSEQNRDDALAASASANRSANEAQGYAKSAETARAGIEGTAANAEESMVAAELAAQSAVESSGESISASVDADNAANHAEEDANRAWLSEKQAADWAEYLAGPVPLADDSYLPNDAPESVQSGYFSARWWAAQAQQIVDDGGSWWLGNHAGPPIVDPPAVEGNIYWDTVTETFWIYVDGGWHEIGRANLTLADEPPKNPMVGDIWMDSGTTAEEYTWTGYEWVSMTGGVSVGDDYDVPPTGALHGGRQDDAGLLEWRRLHTGNIPADGDLDGLGGNGSLTHQKPINQFLQSGIQSNEDRIEVLENAPEPEFDTTQLEADIDALEGRVTVNENNIGVNAEGIAANKAGLAAEIQARIQGDVDLGIRIDGLEDGFYDDTELRQLIADEVVARENGDIQLAGQIQKEIADRVAGDAALLELINAGDAHLQLQIDALKHEPETNDRQPIFAVDEPTEYPSEPPEPLEDGDEWYAVLDPAFDYDAPDPEGLDYYIYLGGVWVLQEPPSKYVERPDDSFDGKWLVYREGDDAGEWKPATTDLIETNGQLMFRDIKGRFAPTPEELEGLTNQLKVNRFMWEKLQEADAPNWQRDFALQLRGNFKWNDDGSAALIPDNSYFDADEHPDLEPDPDSGWYPYWKKPGIWWLGGDESDKNPTWEPLKVTHLMLVADRWHEEARPDSDYPWSEFTEFNAEFVVGDLIQVRSYQMSIYHASSYDDATGSYTNNVWRVVEIIPVDGNPGWNSNGYYCYKVERVAPDHYYLGKINTYSPDTYENDEGFFPAEVFHNVNAAEGNFVKKVGGDSMEGPLAIQKQEGEDSRSTNKVQTLGVYSNSDSSSLRLGTTQDRVYVGHNDTSFNGPIKVGKIQEKNADEGIEFADRVILKTEGAEDDEAVTKKYIDDLTRHLQDEIVELEEEIDAIAPSIERGTWTFNLGGLAGSRGQITMYDGMNGSGSPIGLFKNVQSVWLNELDNDGTPHGFANVSVGDFIELFVEGQPDYGLFTVVEVHDETDGVAQYWVMDVDFARSLQADSTADNQDNLRVKIFEAPSAGDGDGFVLKSGDTMSGNLDIDKSAESTDVEAGLKLKGNRAGTTNSAATITFDNVQSPAKGYLTYRSYGAGTWFSLNQDLDLKNKGLHSVGQIRMEPNGSIGSGPNQRLTFHNANSGNQGEGLLVVPRPVDNRRGFAIRGNNADGDEQDMLYSFTNMGKPDAVNYEGKIVNDNNLVNKLYVDDLVASALHDSAKSGQLHTLTTCGNHYTYGDGSDAPDFTNFRTATTSMEYNKEFHFKQLWTSEGDGALLKPYWEPTPQTMFELYIRAKLVLKTPIKDWKQSPRDHMCVVFSPAGPEPMTHEHSVFYHNSTYEVVLTNMRKI